MSRKNVAPVYLIHKQSGKGRTVWRDSLGIRRSRLHPGSFGSNESKAAHAKLCLELAASPAGAVVDAEGLSVVELLNHYREHAKRIYRHPTTGKPTDELRQIEAVIRFVRSIYGDELAASFGPLALRAVREKFIAEGWSRKTVNARVDRIRRIFRWGVSMQLIGSEILKGLEAVDGLKVGRTEAPDLPPIKPAVMADVDKVLPLLTPTVRALVTVQLHSGARAGELVRMRVGDIDRTDADAWVFRPGSHKTTWKGKARTIYFGARCREALAPLILRAGSPDAFVFSPARSEAERNAKRSEERQTKLWPSHARRNEEKRVGVKRQRKPRDHYTTGTYRRAIERGCEAAGVPTFTPHRLRHLAATRVRAELGVDAARALLGHSLASVTEIYSSEVDRALALKAVAKFG